MIWLRRSHSWYVSTLVATDELAAKTRVNWPEMNFGDTERAIIVLQGVACETTGIDLPSNGEHYVPGLCLETLGEKAMILPHSGVLDCRRI